MRRLIMSPVAAAAAAAVAAAAAAAAVKHFSSIIEDRDARHGRSEHRRCDARR